MSVIVDPTRNRAEQVLMQHYLSRPDLIVAMLTAMGAVDIRQSHGVTQSTCPIHNGEGRNFKVWHDKGAVIWCCFTRCQSGKQPIYTLPMRRFEFSKEQAIGWLAHLGGICIDGMNVVVPKEAIEDAEIRAFNRRLGIEASDVPNFFPEEMVLQSMQGGTKYHEEHPKASKRFPHNLLRRFQVGFVKAKTWVWSSGKLSDKGYPVTEGWFDDRVSIPIRLPNGNLIGFSGRRTDDVEFQKYKQLPGTKKGHTLYGLNRAETMDSIRQSKTLIVVEGFGDVWRAHQHGVYNVASFMGTDPSDYQIGIIGQLNLDSVVFYFDGDPAGQLAVQKYSSRLQDIARLANAVPPAGQDPGDLLTRAEFCAPLNSPTPIPFRRSKP